MRIEMATLGSGQVHTFLGGVVVPRPITLISTVGVDGSYNAAPFSAVSSVCNKPPIFMVSIGLQKGERKDTARNIDYSGDFVVNIMDETMLEKTIQTAADYPSGVNEAAEVGLTTIACDRVKSPRIAEALVSLECKLAQKVELGQGVDKREIIFGEVLLAHVQDDLWVNGWLDPSRLKLVARFGSDLYCRLGEVFKMRARRPAAAKGMRD